MVEAYRGGEPLAEVVRSRFVEGFHRGSAVVLGADGTVLTSIGDITAAVFPRSSNKPMQTVGALDSGLDLVDPADLAIASASHRGEPFHVDRVRQLLTRFGLTADDLGCPADLPYDDEARTAVLASKAGPSRLHMNCSGKHAAMLAACVTAGWSTTDYLDPDHPLQRANRAAVERFIDEEIAATGVDGCGAPLFAFSLTALARVFQRFVDAEPGSRPRTVADAMRARPDLVSGTTGTDTVLMRAVPGLLSKGGAEGVAAMALPGVGAVAVKVDDGNQRATVPVAVAALRTLLSGVEHDAAALAAVGHRAIVGGDGRGGSTEVGAVRPLWP